MPPRLDDDDTLDSLATAPAPPAIVGESEPMLDLLERLSAVARITRPVLVIGERGTGKELIAQRLHFLSERWARPLIACNCAAFSEELLDSELFGHASGAYTGATRAREGRFEAADGGTLFLDEVALLSARAQEKLLRVVEYGRFERVGESVSRRVDTRLVAATHADLPGLAAAGRFREDLLDRLGFEVLHLPPLRARGQDILLLAQRYAEKMTAELKRPYFAGFSPAAERALLAYAWPGNVRELKNTVERSVYRLGAPQRPLETSALVFDAFASPWRALEPGTQAGSRSGIPAGAPPEMVKMPAEAAATVLPEVGPASPADDPAAPFTARVAAFESGLLAAALTATHYNQRQAASRLGLGYHQFRAELKKHGLLPPRSPQDEKTPDSRSTTSAAG